MSAPATRRGLIRTLAALPFIGGAAATAASMPPQPTRAGKGCVMLDRLVFFDASLKPNVGDAVLVVDHGHKLAVRTMVSCLSDPKAGLVSVEASKGAHPGSVYVIDFVVFVGTVVGEGTL